MAPSHRHPLDHRIGPASPTSCGNGDPLRAVERDRETVEALLVSRTVILETNGPASAPVSRSEPEFFSKG